MELAQGLDAQGVRGDVDQDRADVDAGDQPPLDGRAHGHGQVGLDLGVDRPAQPLLEQLVDQRGAGRAADQDHLVDLVGLELGVGQGRVQAAERLDQQRLDQVLVLAPVDLHVQVQGHAVLLGDELFLDPGDGVEGELLLGFLDGAEDPRPGRRRLPQVDSVLLVEAVADVVEEQLIEVVAAELRVAVAGEDLDHAVLDLGDRDVERAAAQVVDEEAFLLPRVGVVGEDGGGRLVDDPDDFQPGQLAGLAGGLPLAVVEEGGDRDHGLRDRMSQRLLGAALERPEDDRRDLLGGVLLVAQGDRDFLAHLALDRPDGPLGGEHELVAGRPADEQAALRIEADDRGEDRIAVLLEDDGLAVPDDGDLAVGRSQVDADDRVHVAIPAQSVSSQPGSASPSPGPAQPLSSPVAATSSSSVSEPWSAPAAASGPPRLAFTSAYRSTRPRHRYPLRSTSTTV